METKDLENLRSEGENKIQTKELEYDFIKLIENIGKSGRYQQILMAICLISSFVGYYMLTIIPLMKELPDFVCIDMLEFENDKEYEAYKNNKRFQLLKNEECIKRHCKYDKESISPQIILVDLSSYINFVSDFKMFCHIDEFFGKITQSLFFGRFFGIFIFSYIGDQFGKKIAFFTQFYIILMSLILIRLI